MVLLRTTKRVETKKVDTSLGGGDGGASVKAMPPVATTACSATSLAFDGGFARHPAVKKTSARRTGVHSFRHNTFDVTQEKGDRRPVWWHVCGKCWKILVCITNTPRLHTESGNPWPKPFGQKVSFARPPLRGPTDDQNQLCLHKNRTHVLCPWNLILGSCVVVFLKFPPVEEWNQTVVASEETTSKNDDHSENPSDLLADRSNLSDSETFLMSTVRQKLQSNVP